MKGYKTHIDAVKSISYYSNRVVIHMRVGSRSLEYLSKNTRWSLLIHGIKNLK